MMTIEQTYLANHLADDLGRGRVSEWGCKNLFRSDILKIEDIMTSHSDKKAAKKIRKLLLEVGKDDK